MPKYKVLKSVAHNVGHSFTSLMNYAGDDYVMGHILRFARRTGLDTLTIDLLGGSGSPKELLAAPLTDLPVWYSKTFLHNVRSQGSDPTLVQAAELVLWYNLKVKRSSRTDPKTLSSPFKCLVRVVDTHGRTYASEFNGWWYPDPMPRFLWRRLWRQLKNAFARLQQSLSNRAG